MGTAVAVLIAVLLGWLFGRAPTRGDNLLQQVLQRVGVLEEPEEPKS
jgi:hypothetical protein